MQQLIFQTYIGADGVLSFTIPVGLSNVDLDVVLMLQPRLSSGWPPGYFEQTYGALADDPLTRDEQGMYDSREPLS